MAYNFKNALVNLNEEIRKSGGGGSDIPAIKLDVSQLKIDVSQLQVSMTAVKSSVSNVSAQVAAIQATLESLNPSTIERKIGTWIDGSDLFEKTIDLGSDVALTENVWAETNVNIGETFGGFIFIVGCEGTSADGIYKGQLQVRGDTGNLLQIVSSGVSSTVRYLTLKYKKVTTQNKKGGKK